MKATRNCDRLLTQSQITGVLLWRVEPDRRVCNEHVVRALIDSNMELAASALPHFAHDRLLAAMHVVESLPPPARGALLIGPKDDPLGTILIDANRVCWGAAPGMSGRLRDLLRSHCDGHSRADELEAVCESCRRESRPLHEALEVSGLVTADAMRAALKQHTIESLLAVDAAVTHRWGNHAQEWPMHWVDHEGRGYNPRYTFGVVELLAGAGAQRLDEVEAQTITEHLERLSDAHSANSALVAFSYLPDGTPLYVGASTQLPLTLQDLIELTTWADAALGASSGFSPEVARAVMRAADGGAVAWRHHGQRGQRCAALCVDGPSLRALTEALGKLSLPVVLGARTQVLDRVRMRTRQIKQGA